MGPRPICPGRDARPQSIIALRQYRVRMLPLPLPPPLLLLSLLLVLLPSQWLRVGATTSTATIVHANARITAATTSEAAVDPTSTVVAPCVDGNTLVRGPSELEATAYDDQCQPRRFRVRSESSAERSLNLSHLDLRHVRDYPRVFTLLLSSNHLDAFVAPASDDHTLQLDLHGNAIRNLSALRLPPSLLQLDLSDNQIAGVDSAPPWLSSKSLQTLALDRNPLQTIAPLAFQVLLGLKQLSLVSASLENVSDLHLPRSLQCLNLSGNALASTPGAVANGSLDLRKLDLSGNRFTTFPTVVSSIEELNLATNAIATIEGVRLPPRLTKLNLAGNPLKRIELAQTDVRLLEALPELIVPTTALETGKCSPKATQQTVRDIPVCVLRDDDWAATYEPPSSPPPTGDPREQTKDKSTESANAKHGSSSALSGKAVVLIGAGCFVLGLLMAAFVFVARRRKHRHASANKPPRPNDSTFALDQHSTSADDVFGDESWVFDGSDKQLPMAVAMLGDGARGSRKHGKLDDLLVFEIPLEELTIREALRDGASSSHSSGDASYRAEYQGFQVVTHVLRRGKLKRRRPEREFLDQVRLASTLEHSGIVQFIGITFGSNSQTQRLTQRWKMGVVFEWMHHGSLTRVFQDERTRRDGQLYCLESHADRSNGPTRSNPLLSSWYPPMLAVDASGTSATSWRCKISIALDVAAALVYLHSVRVVHGQLSADTVLVNDLGEAKLSAMDIDLTRTSGSSGSSGGGSHRSSGIVGRIKVPHVFSSSSITASPQGLDSSFLGANPTTTTSATPTPPSIALNSQLLQLQLGMDHDVYAFGLLLWELDTLVRVASMEELTEAAGTGRQHQMLRFSPECPPEIQTLARRCWHTDLTRRPSMLEIQEDLVRLLESRMTLSDQALALLSQRWSRQTNSSVASGASSSSRSLSEFGMTPVIVVTEHEV